MFQLRYNVTGDERKRLVKAISDYTQKPSRFLGVPSCAYEVDRFHIDRSGCVGFDDDIDKAELTKMIEALISQGFIPEGSDHTEASDRFIISKPLDGFDPDSLDRLQKLVDGKAALIQKAIGASCLTIRLKDEKVEFPWWDRIPEPEEAQAYTDFIAAICRMAKDAKRVTATEKAVESEKYAFRSFLLRLGFIGSDSKPQRKILLKNLPGSAAFPSQKKADAFNAAQKAKREEVSE